MIANLKLFTADHTPLETNEVTINTLFAYPRVDKRGKALEAAITVQRYPAIACIKITSYKDRVKGMADAEMLIDHAWWINHDEEQCKAVIDHELTHLVVATDKYDRPKRDQAGRPVLKIRLHDYQIGLFHGVARRHGVKSQEFAMTELFRTHEGQQLYLPGLFVPAQEPVAVA